MTTIKELGEKYGGIIAEYVSACQDENKDCEEEPESLLLKDLVTKLKNREIIDEKLAMYSCSEQLFSASKRKAIGAVEKEVTLEGIRNLCSMWNFDSKVYKNIFYSACKKGQKDVIVWLKTMEKLNLSLMINGARHAFVNDIVEVIEYLYTIESKLKVPDYSLLHDMSRNGCLECFKWVNKKWPRLDLRVPKNSCLLVALQYNNINLAKWLYKTYKPREDLYGSFDPKLAFKLALRNEARDSVKWLLENFYPVLADIWQNIINENKAREEV